MIVTFGEIMMRLAPTGYLRMSQTKQLEMTFGGGEANVAVSLANYGKEARFVTGLPDNDIGAACKGELRRWGVDISKIITKPGRMGIYFCEKGASQRPSKVIYDRADSVVSKLSATDFDWDNILEGAEWFHFTGITPALSDSMAEATLAACQTAKKKGIPISCDLNYRKKLWSREKAGKVMGELMPYVDLLIANEEDAADVFGIHAAASNITKGEINLDGYRSVAEQLIARFGVKKVAITLRESVSASCNHWSALLYDGKELYVSKKYTMQIVDRVGGGDSFGGGLIYGLTEGYDCQKALEFAVAASCLKHSIEGDFNAVSVAEVTALAGGDGSGRVQR
ncbi:MAG: sugar kinase [Clostridiales bacterium]|nr:sugar kinase [Clostridiales bacterium]